MNTGILVSIPWFSVLIQNSTFNIQNNVLRCFHILIQRNSVNYPDK